MEWLHGRYFTFIAQNEGFTSPASFAKKHMKIGFTAFEWGIIKRRVLEGASEENELWQAADRVFHCWCAGCGWSGEITPASGAEVASHEPEH